MKEGWHIGSDTHTAVHCRSLACRKEQLLKWTICDSPRTSSNWIQRTIFLERVSSENQCAINKATPSRPGPCYLQPGGGPGVLVLWEVVAHLCIEAPCHSSMGHAR